MINRIALVTDFGLGGPYVGQMQLRLAELVPAIRVLDLISDLPPFRPDLSAYFIPALVRDMPDGTLYLCVVDPGVGGGRGALVIKADGCWYVGPDNGLMAAVAQRGKDVQVLRVDWRPEHMSDSFHGRDLFAPIAAMLCDGKIPPCTDIEPEQMVGGDWPCDLLRIVYVDHYGNLMTGLRAAALDREAILDAGGRKLGFVRTFCEGPPGTAFWYENSFGLVELAVNQGSAGRDLRLAVGDPIGVSM